MNWRCPFQVMACLISVFLDITSASNFQAFANDGMFCFWTKSLSDGRTHRLFLRRTAGERVERSLLLYDSIWNKDNSLGDCITSDDPAVTETYRSECAKNGSRTFSDAADGRFNVSAMVGPDGPCVATGRLSGLRSPVRRSRDLESADHRDQKDGEISSTKLRRSKRAWIIPGTLWCGAGHTASNFADLGMFGETDKCCREHDHCKHSISSFGFRYGVFNTNLFTLSHCDCDNKFRRCLHSANDSMSDVVGYGYFNVLKMQCFEFSERMQCAKRAWWGICQLNQLTTYALVKDALSYNSTLLELEETLGLTALRKTSAEDQTTTVSAMSTKPISEDGRNNGESKSTVSIATRTSSTTNRPHDPQSATKDSSQTQVTVSPQTKMAESTVNQTTDSSQTQTNPQPTQMTDSPLTQTTESQPTQMTDSTGTTDAQRTQVTVSQQTSMTDSSSPQPTDSTQTQTNSQQTQMTASPETPTTDSKPTQPTDSPQIRTTANPHITNSTKTQINSTPTKSPHDSPQTQTSASTKTHIQPEIHTKQKGKLETCEGYKDLDSCRHQIPALQEKFGLRNNELTTLYHCSCTSRLAREFAGHEKVNNVHFLLLDFVSQFCFVLPQNCTSSESCPTSTEVPLIQRWTKDVAAGQHLVGNKRKAKRLNSKRAKRKDSSFRLYKKCMRMHFKLHKPNEPKMLLQGRSTSL